MTVRDHKNERLGATVGDKIEGLELRGKARFDGS